MGHEHSSRRAKVLEVWSLCYFLLWHIMKGIYKSSRRAGGHEDSSAGGQEGMRQQRRVKWTAAGGQACRVGNSRRGGGHEVKGLLLSVLRY